VNTANAGFKQQRHCLWAATRGRRFGSIRSYVWSPGVLIPLLSLNVSSYGSNTFHISYVSLRFASSTRRCVWHGYGCARAGTADGHHSPSCAGLVGAHGGPLSMTLRNMAWRMTYMTGMTRGSAGDAWRRSRRGAAFAILSRRAARLAVSRTIVGRL